MCSITILPFASYYSRPRLRSCISGASNPGRDLTSSPLADADTTRDAAAPGYLRVHSEASRSRGWLSRTRQPAASALEPAAAAPAAADAIPAAAATVRACFYPANGSAERAGIHVAYAGRLSRAHAATATAAAVAAARQWRGAAAFTVFQGALCF